MGEAHGAFGGAEHGFNGLLAFLVEGVFFQPGLYGLAPWFGGLPDWLGIGRQAEVIGPLPPGAPECHQRLDPACLQGRHGRAAGNAGVDQNCAGQADSRLHAQHGLSEARRVGRGCDQVGGQDQLRPLGGHYGLGAEGLPVFVRVRAARRSAVWVGQVALPIRRRFVVRRPGWAAAPFWRRMPLLLLQPAQRCRWPASRSTHARSQRRERNLDAFASTLVPLIDAAPSRSSPASRASSSTCRNAVPPKRAAFAAERAALLVRRKAATVSRSGRKAVDRQSQHQTRVTLRLAARARGHLERARWHAIRRSHDGTGHVAFGQLRPGQAGAETPGRG